MKTVPPRAVNKSLTCILTKVEKADYSDALVELMSERAHIEVQKKSQADMFKRKLDGNTDLQDTIATKLRTGEEERLVECEIRYFQPDNDTKQIVRLDTGDIVKTEPLTEDEKQMNLFGDAPDLNDGDDDTPDEEDDTPEKENVVEVAFDPNAKAETF